MLATNCRISGFEQHIPLSPQVCIDDRADKQPDDCADVRTKRLAIPVTYDVAHSLADAQPVGNSVWQPDRGTNDKPPKHQCGTDDTSLVYALANPCLIFWPDDKSHAQAKQQPECGTDDTTHDVYANACPIFQPNISWTGRCFGRTCDRKRLNTVPSGRSDGTRNTDGAHRALRTPWCIDSVWSRQY